ncbi:MAG: hypothetical protein NTZ56_03725 [Acidobacteria bacterium]|nr:hypothetical protein [Acidobacteriota bacterium]
MAALLAIVCAGCVGQEFNPLSLPRVLPDGSKPPNSEGEYVFFDPKSGHLVVFEHSEGNLSHEGRRATVELARYTEPEVRVSVSAHTDGFTYSYWIGNGQRAKQQIKAIRFADLKFGSISVSPPSGWVARVPSAMFLERFGTKGPMATRAINVTYEPLTRLPGKHGVAAGENVRIELTSKLRPGPVWIWFQGNAATPEFFMEPTQEIQSKVVSALHSKYNYQQVLSFGPRFEDGPSEPIAKEYLDVLNMWSTERPPLTNTRFMEVARAHLSRLVRGGKVTSLADLSEAAVSAKEREFAVALRAALEQE